jgi:hypothetical protein
MGFTENASSKPPVSGPLNGGPPRPFAGRSFRWKTSGMPKTKTHPGFGVKIRGKYKVIFPKKPRIKDFLIRAKSGRFTRFSGRQNYQLGPDTGLFLM